MRVVLLTLACTLAGVGYGYACGRARGAAQLHRAVELAGQCVQRFDALAVETVRCARLVAAPHATNRRSALEEVTQINQAP
jgi:hypothetical protein